MERVTNALNMASAVIIVIAGFYIYDAYASILTLATRVTIWAATVLFLAVQTELTGGYLRRNSGQ